MVMLFKHELSLIVMNLWSLHGNSCSKIDNDYPECPLQGGQLLEVTMYNFYYV